MAFCVLNGLTEHEQRIIDNYPPNRLDDRCNCMKISIIVPVYNTEEHILRECLNSLVSQTLPDIEIIVVDDGSDSLCAAVCDEYSGNCYYVKAIHIENQGVSAARNKGISLARGKYLMFVDADDWLEADVAAQYYAYAQLHQLDILLSGCTLFDQEICTPSFVKESRVFTPHAKKELQRAILDNNPAYFQMWPMSPWAKLFRTDFVRAHRLAFTVGLKRMQDNLFCLQALECTDRVGYLACAGYYYRQTAISVCHRFNPDYRRIFESVLVQFKDFAESASDSHLFMRAYYVKGIIILITEYPQLYYLHPDNPQTWKALCQEYRQLCQGAPYAEIIKHVRVMDCYCAYRLFCFVLKRGWYSLLWLLLGLQKKKSQLL